MLRKNASYLILSLLLVNLLTCAFNIRPVIAYGAIYIRSDGSIDPPTAPIQRSLDMYTFTDDISGSIVIEKDNIVVNGAGHTLQGTGSETGIDLSQRTNVTIQNMKIKTFDNALYISSSNHVTISTTTIADNSAAIWLSDSSNNSIQGNNITTNVLEGIYLLSSSDNSISGNNITANTFDGIYLFSSSNNSISENNIINNGWGVTFYYSSDNKIFHNNFINNTNQVEINESYNSTWDNGYPSGGNYWNNYTGVDYFSGPSQNEPGSDGIGDTPHVIDANNADNYPLMNPWTNIAITNVLPCKTVVGEGYSLSINVTVENQGYYNETFDVTTYHNMTNIVPTQTIALPSRGFTTITFVWNTAGVAKGNYTISAIAWPVPGETDTLDNTLTDGWIIVAMPGDITGLNGYPDGKVDMRDIYLVAKGFGSYPSHPRWNPNADINNDGKVDMRDIYSVARNFGKTDP